MDFELWGRLRWGFFVADIVAVEAVVLLDSGHQNAGFVFVSVVRHARLKPGPRI